MLGQILSGVENYPLACWRGIKSLKILLLIVMYFCFSYNVCTFGTATISSVTEETSNVGGGTP